jgi:ribosomal protein S13
MTSLMDIEGIAERYSELLKTKAGIRTTEALLKACATPTGRQEVANKTGISHKLILEWANLADLMRIKGIGEEYSDLLEEAGVDTVKELKVRVPANLLEKMAEINHEKHLVRR